MNFRRKMPGRFSAVGAYIYAGGFTIGMRQWFNVLAHLEDGPFGVATVRHNMPDIEVHEEPDNWPLAAFKNVDVAYCNPPCAPWSTAGKGGPVAQDRTIDHMRALSLIDALDPTIWVWESVTQAYLGKYNDLSYHVTEIGMDKGYSVYHFLHDVKFMGLPQQRRRLFTILSKVKLEFFLPPYHDGDLITVGDVLPLVSGDPGIIPRLNPRYQATLTRTPQGGNLRKQWMAEGNDAPGPMWMSQRLDENSVSGTQIGTAHLLHPTEHRMLGHRETQVICGYPPDYEFVTDDKAGPHFPQIARAVTPPAGCYLGEVLYAGLAHNESFATPEEWVINYMGVNNRVDTREMLEVRERLR